MASAFVYGFTSSLHCVAMCGPFVATMNVHSSSKWRINLVYNAGRFVSYSLLGFLLGYVSLGIKFTGDIMQVQMLAAYISAAFVIFLGISMIFAGRTNSGFFNTYVKKIFSPVLHKISKNGTGVLFVFLFGLFTGLLPCGVLYPAFAIAFASGSPWTGAMLMSVFFLGTFPGLFIFGIGFYKLKSRITPQIILWVGLIFILIGLFTIYARLNHDHSAHSGQENHHNHHH